MLPWPSSRSMAYRPNDLGITTERESRSSIASKLPTLRLRAVHSPVSQSPCGQRRRKLEGRASFIDSASERGQVESLLYRAIDLARSLRRGTPEGRQMRCQRLDPPSSPDLRSNSATQITIEPMAMGNNPR